ncbi:hypothetical protein KIPE111705_40285 [Kibdelosporangium persicum]|uniref:hypothetical protein n=1 Tax=Kibdelosporangium persicum TaxID=2698649 RepID=UPI0015642BA5|nr:hypothetical protein [Kibdelosporangium persicum]
MARNRTSTHARAKLCYVCGVELRRRYLDADYPSDGPLRAATPYLRMVALAADSGVDVFEVSATVAEGLGGAVGVGFDSSDAVRGTIGLAEDLDEDLRTDILAFGFAVFADIPREIAAMPNRAVGIKRERRARARHGPGHLAWHMLYSCGRDTESATFTLVRL